MLSSFVLMLHIEFMFFFFLYNPDSNKVGMLSKTQPNDLQILLNL